MDGQVPRVNLTTGALMPPSSDHVSDLILAWREESRARAVRERTEDGDAHVDLSRLKSKVPWGGLSLVTAEDASRQERLSNDSWKGEVFSYLLDDVLGSGASCLCRVGHKRRW
jgi:hypothetical protein